MSLCTFRRGSCTAPWRRPSSGPWPFTRFGGGWGRSGGPSRAPLTPHPPPRSPSGPRASRHPPHAPHRAHLRVSGTASQTLWHQGAILMWPLSGRVTPSAPPPQFLRRPGGGGQARPEPHTCRCAPAPPPSLPGGPETIHPSRAASFTSSRCLPGVQQLLLCTVTPPRRGVSTSRGFFVPKEAVNPGAGEGLGPASSPSP